MVKARGTTTNANQTSNTANDDSKTDTTPDIETNTLSTQGAKNDSKGDKDDKGEEESKEKSSLLGTAGRIVAGAAGAATLATVAPGLVGSVLGTGQPAGGDPLATVAAAGAANNTAAQNGTQPSLFDITSRSFLNNGSPPPSNGFAMLPMGAVQGVDSYASSSVPQVPSTHDFGLGLNSPTNYKPLSGLPSGNVNGDIGIGVGGIGVGVGGIGVGGIGVGGIGGIGVGVGGIGVGSVITAF